MENIINWIKNLFKKKDFDVDKFIEESESNLQEKLEIIYESESYKNAKKQIFEWHEEFKEEHKDKIGKYFESDFGCFKILKVKEPWFLKSPILIDSANFEWKFDESFEVEPFDSTEFWEVTLQDLEYSTQISKEYLIKRAKEFVNYTK